MEKSTALSNIKPVSPNPQIQILEEVKVPGNPTFQKTGSGTEEDDEGDMIEDNYPEDDLI